MEISKMTLGTVQMGLDYGISNKIGKPSLQSSVEILKLAVDSGVIVLDTAAAYGNSEEVIGTYVAGLAEVSPVKMPVIVTKLPAVKFEGKPFFAEIHNYVRTQVLKSLDRLKIKQIPVYLLHRAADMINYEGQVIKSLVKLKEEGLIRYLGASVYSPDDVREFLKIKELDAIQIPLNLFDTKLLSEGLLAQLAAKETMVFVRSVFLQGLFFMKPDNLPEYMSLAKEPLSRLRSISDEVGLSIGQIAVSFVRDIPGVTSLVLGVETVEQLKDNIELMAAPPLSESVRQKIMDTFSDLPEVLTNPGMWKKGG